MKNVVDTCSLLFPIQQVINYYVYYYPSFFFRKSNQKKQKQKRSNKNGNATSAQQQRAMTQGSLRRRRRCASSLRNARGTRTLRLSCALRRSRLLLSSLPFMSTITSVSSILLRWPMPSVPKRGISTYLYGIIIIVLVI